MRSHKRKAILVIADRFCRDLPALDRMATFAVRAKLAAMYVGMAVCAMGAHILEDQIRMALRAGNFRMHAAQWVTRLIVVELRIRPDRFPACVAVALLAGDGDGAVRIRDLGLRPSRAWPGIARLLLQCGTHKQWQKANQNCREPTTTFHSAHRIGVCVIGQYGSLVQPHTKIAAVALTTQTHFIRTARSPKLSRQQ